MYLLLDDITEITNCVNINSFITEIPVTCNMPNLLCIHTNIRSTKKNFDSLEQNLQTCNLCIDVIILTEVNISVSIKDLYSIDGYQMHTELRNGRKGGGIIIYVHNKHKLKIHKQKTHHFESIFFSITTPTRYSASLCAIYRPPNLSKHLFINELCSKLEKYNNGGDFYVFGDINIDITVDSPIRHKYTSMLHSAGFACGISEYTRIQFANNKISKSCIDHIYARTRTQNVFTAALGTVLADHRAIALASYGPRQAEIQDDATYKIIYNRRQLDQQLNEINWNTVEDMTCPNRIYKFLYENINNCYKKSEIKVKVKKNTNKQMNCKWINNKILRACKYRDNLFSKWIKDTNNCISRQKYNHARNYANKLIFKAKNKSIVDEIMNQKNNPRNLWHLLNRITGRIRLSVDSVLLNAFKRNFITTTEIANNFANNFLCNVKNVIPNCKNSLLNKADYRIPVDVSMHFQKANTNNVLKIIKTMNTNKSPGLDGIRAIDIKKISHKIAAAIAKLINSSIEKNIYPSELKTGIVRPIFKKGRNADYDNYRPITILPTVDKIIERFLCHQIYKFYADNNILSETQYGFQPSKNTTQLLTAFTDLLNSYLNDRMHVLVVFIDYSKAFDTLRHEVLLERLDDCGVRGPVLGWCKDYLNDRAFYVKVAEMLSDKKMVDEGTAQGSVLGPLHYLSYVNNLPNVIQRSKIFQFADDTCLVAAHHDINVALNELQVDFDNLIKWSHDAGLVLNVSKTKLMYISSSQNRKTQEIKLIAHKHDCLHNRYRVHRCDCVNIDVVSKHIYLGLIIDDRLKWTEHINMVCDKLKAILSKFAIIKYKIPYTILLNLYKALGESIIGYGLSSYGLTSKSHLDRIYELQLRLLKTIVPTKVKDRFVNNYYGLFFFCKVLPVHQKVKYCLLTEQYFNKDLQVTFSGELKTRQQHEGRLIIPSYTNLYGKNKLNITVPILINNLPMQLKQEINNKNIKYKIKEHLLKTLNT